MSRDLILPHSELRNLLDWAAAHVGDSLGTLEDAEERIERQAGIFRQQQQISRETERLWEDAEARKTPEQKRADNLRRAKIRIFQAGITFLRHWFSEARSIVCNDEKLSQAASGSSVTASSIAAGLAATLASDLSITSPVAVGLATIILTIVGTAGLSAFCAMSKDEATEVAAQVRDEVFGD